MIIVVKSGQRQTLQVTCKKVVIKITDYKLRCKRSKSLKIKAKGEQPQISQARLWLIWKKERVTDYQEPLPFLIQI